MVLNTPDTEPDDGGVLLIAETWGPGGACKYAETKQAGLGGVKGVKGVFRHHSHQKCGLWCLFYSSTADLCPS